MAIPKKTKNFFKRQINILRWPPKMTISEWAARNRIVSGEETSAPGPWYADRAPYTIGIMDAISDPTIERIVLVTGAQMGKTNAGILNPVGYYIEHDPCPIMIVQPTIAMGSTFSGKRLTSMLRDTPSLRNKIAVEKSRSSENKIHEKSFPGGYLVIAGANSAPSLKSRPIRILLFDEVDEAPFDLEGQGNPIELAVARTNAFPNRKIVLVSTPTVKGKSRIDDAFNESSKERWMHKCPGCGKWSQYGWQNRLDFTTLKMSCPYCNEYYTRMEWEENGGKWVAENPDQEVRGFHVNALDSQEPWDKQVTRWAEAQRLAKAGNFTNLKTFINTVLAETWEERGEVIESHALESRCEVYHAELPDGVCVLTMGVDVQDNRLAYEIVGWGMGFESWGILYGETHGDPRQGKVWDDIDTLLSNSWSYKNGKRIKISRTAIDIGGHRTPQVYLYCNARIMRGVYPVKGEAGDKIDLVRPSKKSREKNLFIVGVDGIKTDIMSWLKVGEPGDGYCHFPKDEDNISINGYDASYFEMLTAEKKVLRQDKKGYRKYEWTKSPGSRNESFDCRVYARAALRIMYSNDNFKLKRIFLAEPWADSRQSNNCVADKNIKIKTVKKKATVSKNKRAMEQGIYL
jgi:phage terminase large subunit GpA-like protein